MTACKYCGKWAGIANDEHLDCAQMAKDGRGIEEIRRSQGLNPDAISAIKPLTRRDIFFGTFLALWAWTISASLIVFLVRSMMNLFSI